MPPEVGHAVHVRVPDHVVHREFQEETVVLNLETGQYHGLNATARRMFAALEEAGTIRGAAGALAERFGMSGARVERDLLDLCAALGDRGLLEFDDAAAV